MFQPYLLLTSLTSTSTLIVHSCSGHTHLLAFPWTSLAMLTSEPLYVSFSPQELSFPCHHMACFLISTLSSFLKCYLFSKPSLSPFHSHPSLLSVSSAPIIILLCFIYFLSHHLKAFLSFFFFPCCAAFGILFPQPGIEPGPQQWKHKVLTTKLLKTPHFCLFYSPDSHSATMFDT